MTAPKAILKDKIIATTFAQLEAVGSNEGIAAGLLGYTEDQGQFYRCQSVDGANASTWVAASTGHGYFDPMAVPSTAHPNSQEFSGGDISGMTAWNPGSNMTLDAWNGFLRVRNTRGVSNQIGGAYCAVPGSGAWSVTTVIDLLPHIALASSGVTWGLAIWDSNVASSPTTARSRVFEFFQPGNLSSNATLRVIDYLDFTGGSVGINLDLSGRFLMTQRMFLRFRYDPSGTPRFSWDFSLDGMTWFEAFTTTTAYLTGAPAHAGVFIQNALGTGAIADALCPFLRFTNSAARTQLAPGRVI